MQVNTVSYKDKISCNQISTCGRPSENGSGGGGEREIDTSENSVDRK